MKIKLFALKFDLVLSSEKSETKYKSTSRSTDLVWCGHIVAMEFTDCFTRRLTFHITVVRNFEIKKLSCFIILKFTEEKLKWFDLC